MVPEAIRSTYVDMLKEPRCVQHVALDRFCWPTLRFPPLGPPGRVPQLQRYYQSATTSYRHLAALRFLRLAIPQRPLVDFAPWRTSEPPWPGVGNPVSPAGISLRSKSRTLPSSWGTSVIRLPCSIPTPAGLLMSDHCDTAAWPLVCEKQRLPRKVSELNSMAFQLAVYASWSELPQYHARLASSCWSGSTDRDSHPQGSAERFQSCRLHLIPPSQALLDAIASTEASFDQPELASV